MQSQREKRKAAYRRNRRKQSGGHPGRKEWRMAPANPPQLNALRKIASATGCTFTTDISQGQAWKRIRGATKLIHSRARKACAPPWYTPKGTRPKRHVQSSPAAPQS